MSDERMAWDDGRLEAAYGAFAGTAVPPHDLASATSEQVRTRPARRPWWRRPSVLVGSASVAAAALAVVAIAWWPQPTTPSVGQAPPVADLPVIDVPALIERTADPSPEEVIVRGWYIEVAVEADCDVVEDPHPLVPYCTEWYHFLTAEPEVPTGRGGPLEPVGPFVVPMLRADAHVDVPLGSDQPIEVLAVGHVADHRVGTCPEADQAECAGRFVIDRLLPVDAPIVDVPEPWVANAPPASEPEAAVAALVGAVGPVSVVSIGTIPAADLPSIEPLAAGDEPVIAGTAWVIRAFVDGESIARTFVLTDGALATSPITEVTASGSPDSSAATVRPIGDVPGGWEVTIVDGDPSRTVTVIDRTGTIATVRLPSDDESRLLTIDSTGMRWAALDAKTSLVGWGGTPCELEQGLEVERMGGVSLGLTGRSDALCRSKLVTTQLVLVWAQAPGDLGLTDTRGSAAFPATAAGLPVVPTSEATAVRDANDDHEVAIKGWYSLDPRADCGATDIGALLDPGCRSPARSGSLFGPEGGDGIRFVTPNPGDLVAAADGSPVVLVGHFDDARAEDCANPTACQDVLFVDALWIDGRLTSGHWSWGVGGSSPEITADVINRLLPEITPSERDVSVGTLAGARLALLQPKLAGSSAEAEPWVWHVTRLEEDRVRTYLVTQAQALESIETGERHFYQEMADGQFEELTVNTIVD